MHLAPLDWIIIAAYLSATLAAGLWFHRRASGSPDDFFLAGRNLPWYLAGTSMAATTFAADTPLAITEYVREGGIWRNWFWWAMAFGHVLGVFLFARLWRRAEVLTDAELCTLRYDGPSSRVLRKVKAFLFAVPYNVLVMGWVIAAMGEVIHVLLGVDPFWAVTGLCAVALLYAGLSGLWGVVLTDLLQFLLALGGTIAFALVAVGRAGGMHAMLDAVGRQDPSGQTLRLLPDLSAHGSGGTWLSAPGAHVLILATVLWWANHNADGGGALMQRSAAARDERHALLAAFWFSLLHYAVRAWPWIVVALCSLVLLPALPAGATDRSAYPLLMRAVLPVGLKGLLVASFLAAFMSTVDTHLNWGASYLVGDLYRPARPGRSDAHYLVVARLATALLLALAAVASRFVTSIHGAWEFVWALGAGLGPVLILRWFWWRINAWSELSALAASLLTAMALQPAGLPVHLQALILVPVTVACWLPVTWLTSPTHPDHLARFYGRVVPGGRWSPAWRRARNGILPHGDEHVAAQRPASTTSLQPVLRPTLILDVSAGLAVVLGLGFAIGSALLLRAAQAAVLLAFAALGGIVLFWRHGRWRHGRPRTTGRQA